MTGGFQLDIKMLGSKEIQDSLKTIPEKMRSRVLAKVVGKAARQWVPLAKQNVPVDLGLLKKSLGVKVKAMPRKGLAFAVVGPRKGFEKQVSLKTKIFTKWNGEEITLEKKILRNPVKYAHLVEFGTKPHQFKAKRTNPNQKPKYIQHPGTQPHPFLRPAYDKGKQPAISTVSKDIAIFINKEWARESAKARKRRGA